MWRKKMKNLELFEYSKNHLEEVFDKYYAKDVVVIPKDSSDENELTKKNTLLIENISAFNVLIKQGKDYLNESIQKIVDDIVDILVNTPSINYSAFSQYFMVQNTNYTIFKNLPVDEKKEFVYEMLKRYCEDRHEMYLSHGYSNIVLQVMCDNYSHKRNSKTGINKFEELVSPLKLESIAYSDGLITEDNYIFLPDKGDSVLFETFLKILNIEMKSREIEHNKLPDVVFKYKGEYYICELKTMKQGGGGQDKQIVEVANFIRYQEKNKHFHYITFLDSLYYNRIVLDDNPKMETQRKDIEDILSRNPQNYFLNTQSLIKFIDSIK